MTVLIAVHAAAGTAALVLGPLALAGRSTPSTLYRLLVVVVAVTAVPAAAASTLPIPVRLTLVAVAVASAVAVGRGTERGLRASYVSLVAALAFVSAPVWAGVLVVGIGSAVAHTVPLRSAPAVA